MRLWLDDKRPKPFNFDKQAFTADEAKAFLLTGKVTEMSLDYHLGGDDYAETGLDVAEFIERGARLNLFPKIKMTLHSSSQYMRLLMLRPLRKAIEHWNNHDSN